MYQLKKAIAGLMIRRSQKERGLSLEELETKHVQPAESLFNDSSYFLGRGEDGSHMVVRMAFRSRRDPEYWLAFHLTGKGTFELRELDDIEGEGFQLGTLNFVCLEPGKSWRIQYSGTMYQGDVQHHVVLDLLFEGTRPLVNFKNITRPSDTSPVIARERWTKDFLVRLKEIKKVHLEQGGKITGDIVVDGEKGTVEWRSIRDHSWGTRSWETWKRHVWLGGVLDNGEAFNLSLITYDFLGQLSAGYMTRGDELVYVNALPDVESFASNPLIPLESTIEFTSRDGTSHTLVMKMPHSFDFLMDQIYHIREGMGDFLLDGVHGLGVAEFGLNTDFYDITPV